MSYFFWSHLILSSVFPCDLISSRVGDDLLTPCVSLSQGRSSAQPASSWTPFLCTTRSSWRSSAKPGILGTSCLSRWVGGNSHVNSDHGSWHQTDQSVRTGSTVHATCLMCFSFSRFGQHVLWKLHRLLLQFPGFLHMVSAASSTAGTVYHILLR